VPAPYGDRLAQWARERPDQTAVHCLGEGAVTYAELFNAARVLAARLVDLPEGRYGGRFVLIALPTGLGYVLAFHACLLAGVTAVPFYPPGLATSRARAAFGRRLREILADCDPSAVFGTPDVLDAVDTGAVRYASPEPIEPETELLPAPHDGVALLQYTSGSTATPKGVLVTQDNLAHNCAGMAWRLGSTPGESATSWLPLFHDMGLIGMLAHPLWAGMTVHLMSPSAFVRRPMRWLETISATGSVLTMAPDFAYALAARRADDVSTLDLSALRLAITAAEPIRPATLAAFAEAFAPAGLRPTALTPGYGLAENTLCVVAADRAVDPLLVGRLVGCGSGPFPGTRTAIVDPATRRRCPVGEIWVSGTSVAAGYWRRPAETVATFQARIDGEPGQWLRTGDLGRVVDGQLCVTGRLKDVIIHNGHNVHPDELEAASADCHPDLVGGGGAAFESGGRVVLVREITAAGDTAEILRCIRLAVAEETGIALDTVVLVRRAAIPRTTSGKVRRGECARSWADGELTAIARWNRDNDEGSGHANPTGAPGVARGEPGVDDGTVVASRA
jgi:acyl-CoA synthetase (AMP-forming)/AMP-acid ligase II